MKIQTESKGQIVLYKNRFEVRLEKETVWLDAHQIASLFGVNRPAIVKHINNIYKSYELNKKSTCSILEQVAADGKIRKMNIYNLDMIISVGYRVNSKRATQFRIWATNVLKKHLVNGYTINEKRLKMAEHKYLELKKSLKLLGNVISLENVSDETKGLIQVITEYSHALEILDDYDNNRLLIPKGTKQLKHVITYDEARIIIDEMKTKIKIKSSSLFGQEKDKSFESSINTIYQTFDGK